MTVIMKICFKNEHLVFNIDQYGHIYILLIHIRQEKVIIHVNRLINYLTK
jgi:hypothetical protein